MLKVLGINLLVFISYGLLIILNTAKANLGFSIAVGMGVCIFIQVMLNVVVAVILLIMGKRDWVKAFFISAAVLAPVGFVTWLVLLSIYS